MKKACFIFALLAVPFLAVSTYAGTGSGGAGGYTWKVSYKNCYDRASGTWDTYQECDEANGTCTDQYCAPC